MTSEMFPVILPRMKTFNGRRLEKLRLHNDMSRGDLAFSIRHASGGRIKATERGVRGWERGDNAPHSDTMNVIAEVLGVDSSHFYTSPGEDEDAEEEALPSHHELLEALRPIAMLLNRRAA